MKINAGKLIKLPNGVYMEAGRITYIRIPYFDNGKYSFNMCYYNSQDVLEEHLMDCPDHIKDQESAVVWVDIFVADINKAR